MRHRKMNDAFVDYHLSIDARNPLLVPAMPLEWSIESFSVGLHKESQRRIRGIRGGVDCSLGSTYVGQTHVLCLDSIVDCLS